MASRRRAALARLLGRVGALMFLALFAAPGRPADPIQAPDIVQRGIAGYELGALSYTAYDSSGQAYTRSIYIRGPSCAGLCQSVAGTWSSASQACSFWQRCVGPITADGQLPVIQWPNAKYCTQPFGGAPCFGSPEAAADWICQQNAAWQPSWGPWRCAVHPGSGGGSVDVYFAQGYFGLAQIYPDLYCDAGLTLRRDTGEPRTCGVRYLPCPSGYRASTTFPNCERIPAQVATADDGGKSLGDPVCEVGNPCNPANGNKYQVEVDYVGAGPFPLRFERRYNSLDWVPTDSVSPMGAKWRHNYQQEVIAFGASGSNFAAARRRDGRRVLFGASQEVWRADPDVVLSLSRATDSWSLRNERDELETYNSSGQLIAITNRAGLSQTLSYDAAGRLTSARDPFGRALQFTYDAQGHLLSLTDPAGGVYAYAYDQLGRLTGVTYPNRSMRGYQYNETANTSSADLPYALTGIVDENGSRFATYQYDPQGRAISTEHAGGAQRVTLSYPDATSAEAVDAFSTPRHYTFQTILGVKRPVRVAQPCSACPGNERARTLAYDENGNVTAMADFNGTLTTSTYDLARNLLTARTEAAGTAVARDIVTEWHPNWRLPTRISEPQRERLMTYDAAGNLLTLTVTDRASGRARTWSYAYNGNGQVITVDGPRTDVADITSYTYDEQGNLTAIINALGHETRITRYNTHGQPEEIIDPNGLVTTLAYDARQRLISRTVGEETTSYAYDAAGQLTKVTLPDGSFLVYTYDPAHRLTAIADVLGNRITYTLDAMGNRIKEERFDTNGGLTQARRREYDGLNRLSKDIGGSDPLAQITRYSYDPQDNLTSISDPLSRVSTQHYDALSRLIGVTDPGGGVTQYGYNALDQLTQVTDARGLTTTYARDGLDNVNIEVSPDAGAKANSYDEAGNLVSSTDARGVVSSFTYDALNRLTRATFTPPAGSTIPAATHTYQYDQGTNGLTRLTAITDPTGSTSYYYDLHGRVVQDTRVIGGVSYATAYQYDNAGRLAGLTYPSGRQVGYTRDSLGRVSAITTSYGSATQVVLAAATYQPFGAVQSFVFGNGQPYTRRFDLDGRITSHTLGASTRSLSYDAASRLTGFTQADASLNQAFGYDSLDRLTSWLAATTSQGYTYDANGNRTSATYGTTAYGYGYDATTNRLASVAGPVVRSYAYDAAGNVSSDGVRNFFYDARGRPIRVVTGSTTIPFGINALGQRVTKGGAAFHFDTAGHLIAESNTAGEPMREYFYLGDLPVAMATFDHDGDGIRDPVDNCILDYNPDQFDASGEGFGNHCDGDADGDGVLSQADVTLIQKTILRAVPYDPAVVARGDVDGSGGLSSYDALQVYKHILAGRAGPGPSGVRGQWRGPELFFIHPDHLGTPRAVVDAVNRVQWRWDFASPFGDTVADETLSLQNGITLRYQRLRMDLRFPGQQYDVETGLHYNYFRDYDPATGRYVQSDPIGLRGGINTYAYVDSNPTAFSDSDGLQRNGGRMRPPRSRSNLFEEEDILSEYFPRLGEEPTYRPIQIETGSPYTCGQCFDVIAIVPVSGSSRSVHRRAANEELIYRAQTWPSYRSYLEEQLGPDVLEQMRGGPFGYRNPQGTEWHHPVGAPDVVWLLRRCEHRDESLQDFLHPAGVGGYGRYYGQ